MIWEIKMILAAMFNEAWIILRTSLEVSIQQGNACCAIFFDVCFFINMIRSKVMVLRPERFLFWSFTLEASNFIKNTKVSFVFIWIELALYLLDQRFLVLRKLGVLFYETIIHETCKAVILGLLLLIFFVQKSGETSIDASFEL